MSNEETLVFVYGSLKFGYGNDHILDDSKFVGEFVTDDDYTMYDLGAFPAILKDGDTAIHGELYNVNSDVLNSLDALEGVPTFYHREMVETSHGKAIIYVLSDTGCVENCDIVISGVWLENDDVIEEEVIEPCPCCGGVAVVVSIPYEWVEYVECVDCGLRTKDHENNPENYDNPVSSWNTRV